VGEGKRKRDLALATGAATRVGEIPARENLDTGALSVVILHLSDIHIGSRHDLILAKADAIARTTNTIAHPVNLWVLLVSGDIARTGTSEEYALAYDFLAEIRRGLRDFHPTSDTAVVVVPGNHDCDFALNSGTRDMLLPQILASHDKVDPSVLTNCLAVQRPFFEFLARLEERSDPGPNGALSYAREFSLGAANVRFNCYNTAWASQRREKQGDLTFPVQAPHAPRASSDAHDCVLSVAVFHHPLAWLQADNRRVFQAFLERSSDIVFTGHEHTTGQFQKRNFTGEVVEYCEGAALQSDGARSESEFNVVEIDATSRRHRLTQYEWASGQYARKGGYRDWLPFVYGAERQAGLAFTDEFDRRLSDPGAQFSHPARDKLLLEDIFVYPDLHELRIPPTPRKLPDIHGAGEISGRIGPTDLRRMVVYGVDESGKTTLAKRLCRDLTKRHLAVVLLSATSLGVADPDAVEGAIRTQELLQYGRERSVRVAQMAPDCRVLLLDDFHRQTSHRKEILDLLSVSFGTIVVFGGEMLKLQELPYATSESNPFYDFKRYEILPMGHQRRAKLVERWFDLSRGVGTDDEVVAKKVRQACAAIESATSHDFAPSYPLFLLVLLQVLEAASPGENPASQSRSYGYLHEVMITAALSSEPPTSIDTSYRYISELAFRMFSGSAKRFSEAELRAHHASYCDDYAMSLNFERMLLFLERVGVLCVADGGQYAFKYKYLYHYFVARALSDDRSRFESNVPQLIDALHREQNASVLMFLVHFDRDGRVVERMLKKARGLYADAAKCDLAEDVARLSAMSDAPVDLLLPARSPDENRERVLAARDSVAVASPRDEAAEEQESTDDLNDIVRVNAALKTIEILGQVARSFPGSTHRSRKREIVGECYALGLRAMKAFIGLILENREDIFRDLTKHLREKGISEGEVGGRAAQFIYWLAEAWVLIFVLKTVQAVGLDTLWQTYDELVSEDPSLGVALIDLGVRLEHFSGFPENAVEDLIARTAKYPFTRGILARLAYRHFYLRRTDFRIRDRLASKLRIRSDMPALQLQEKFRKR